MQLFRKEKKEQLARQICAALQTQNTVLTLHRKTHQIQDITHYKSILSGFLHLRYVGGYVGLD